MKKCLLSLLILLSAVNGYSSGSFSAGLVLGVAGDSGDVAKIARDLNCEMRQIKSADPGAEIEEIPVYYTPSLTVNFSYYYDRLMLRLGWEYAGSILYNETGSITPAGGPANVVEIDYSRFTFPISAGLVIPAGRRSRFYMAGGFNISYAMLEITQSNPGTFSSLPDKKNSYSGYIPGFHYKFGAEVILSRNYSMLFEYTHYMTKNTLVKSDSGNSGIYMGVNTFEIAAGINYTVDTGL